MLPQFSMTKDQHLLYLLAPVTIEQIFTFIINNNKTFCQKDTFGLKTFDSEHLEKTAEYNCDFVKFSS